MNSVKILFSLAANFNWTLHQLDVTNAFLHGDSQEVTYMQQLLRGSFIRGAFLKNQSTDSNSLLKYCLKSLVIRLLILDSQGVFKIILSLLNIREGLCHSHGLC